MTNGPTDSRLLLTLLGVSFSLWSGTLFLGTTLVISRIEAIEIDVGQGILPRAEERIAILERRFNELEEDIEDHLREDH